ncbi:16S rRNA (cytosine1402-N4)-methyltransferase [Haloactinospora alba]|uniref:Ribosomal RNA small subunit methyltransferase H n=1 Tax=Haloactinospora alba TaxID=405555 RepID=A0A543NJF3_9ACTN|nr:16S rRNA (cytosine(1402)-N(4))-methyltransferase RsmH [Haloactinospora alba]TQN31993.1 16S rRNA (cytosine1402-N4)-methyltransferase [Haloactinospora alba]
MADADASHTPVMPDRVCELLSPALESQEAVLVDGTLGLGGHAARLLDAVPGARLVGLDRDTSALDRARRRLASVDERVSLHHADFDAIPRVLDDLGISRVHGLLLDLGVSSPQLDEAERGFAYSYDAPLDMRMDRSQGQTAADVVNTYPVGELARVLRDYGEERFARRIAQAIGRERGTEPLDSTRRLAEIVRGAIPAAARRSGGNPAKRTFQALRIEVNAELTILRRALPAAVSRLAVGGRVVVLSYHSLEDRISKRTLASLATDTTPPDLPVTLEEERPELRLLTRGAEQPGAEESEGNPRAASARLRAAERIRDPGTAS